MPGSMRRHRKSEGSNDYYVDVDFLLRGPLLNDTVWLNVTFSREILDVYTGNSNKESWPLHDLSSTYFVIPPKVISLTPLRKPSTTRGVCAASTFSDSTAWRT